MAKGPSHQAGQAPFFQPFTRGWQVDRPVRSTTLGASNATLLSGVDPETDVNGTSGIKLWVNNVQSTFGISGQTAQSRMRRTFFPHNLAQTNYQVTGQCPSQAEYGRLTEFVRYAQVSTLTSETLMRLLIPASGIVATRNLKGRRKGVDLIGYVTDMPREHERHVMAPNYTFEFTISRSLGDLFQDEAVKVAYIKSWNDIFENPHFQAQFIEDPDRTLHDDHPADTIHVTPAPTRGSRPPVIVPPGKGPTRR